MPLPLQQIPHKIIENKREHNNQILILQQGITCYQEELEVNIQPYSQCANYIKQNPCRRKLFAKFIIADLKDNRGGKLFKSTRFKRSHKNKKEGLRGEIEFYSEDCKALQLGSIK